MFRIVKKGAEAIKTVDPEDGSTSSFYYAFQTLEIGEDTFLNESVEQYKNLSQSLNPYKDMIMRGKEYGDAKVWDDGFSAGVSACLKALGEK